MSAKVSRRGWFGMIVGLVVGLWLGRRTAAAAPAAPAAPVTPEGFVCDSTYSFTYTSPTPASTATFDYDASGRLVSYTKSDLGMIYTYRYTGGKR
jgi:YD repeat-containing protein